MHPMLVGSSCAVIAAVITVTGVTDRGAGGPPAAVAANSTTRSASPTGTPSTLGTPVSMRTWTATAPVASAWLRVVDHRRWTVSHGHVLAHSRTLRTLLLQPSSAGPHALIVFCHGYDSTPMTYIHLLRHWAAAGFIVAAPYFPLTRSGAGRWLDENDVAKQPRDVSVVITAVLHKLGRRIDRRHILVAGHSDGGSTAFAIGFKRRVADHRVTAILVFSGDRWGTAAQFAAPDRRLPLLLVQSDRDESNPVTAAAVLWRIARRPKMYLHLYGARHLPPFATASRWRPIVEAVSTDFVRAWTASNAAARSRELNAADHDGTRSGLASVTDR